MEENTSSTGRDPAEIERDLAETRNSIESTMGELGERLEPSHLADDAKAYVKEKAMRGASSVWMSVRENALPLGMIGCGVVWMLRSARSQNGSQDWRDSRWREGDSSHDGDRRPSVSERAEEMASRTAERAREMTDHVKESARELTGQVRDRAGEMRHRAAEMGYQARDVAGRQVRRAQHGLATLSNEQPLLLGVASLALGAIVGGLLPSTRREDELLGETRDRVVSAAAEAGREKAEQAREAFARSPAMEGNSGDQTQPAQAHDAPAMPG